MNLSQAERYAALLDGKCTAQEREELLAQLAAGGDDLEIFADAAALLHEHEEEQHAGGAIPLHRRASTPAGHPRWKPPRWVIPLAAAAGIAALITLTLPRRGQGEASGAAQTVAMLSAADAPLPPDVVLAQGSLRGPSGGEHVRLGAALVVLEVAARSHDETHARQAAAEIAALLRGMNAPDVAAQYDAIGKAGLPSGGLDPELAERAETGAEQVSMTRFGEWLQAARIAAVRQDTSFFQTPFSRDRLKGKGVPRNWKATAEPLLKAAQTAMTASDWPTVQRELGLLLTGLSR
jgi:hypothetical protein